MSDMMQGPPPQAGGMPPQGGPPQGGMESKMSILNPADMASKLTKGDVRQDQTVAEFFQRNFGVSPQDPMSKLMQNLKGQTQNATMAGKMGAKPPQPAPMGGPAGPPQPPSAGGLDGLMNKI